MTSYKEIDASELSDMLSAQTIRLIDVRNADEVARGIIPGAEHVPLSMLPVQFESLNGNEPLVFYCHSGIRSAQASAFIASKGRDNVYNLRGGVLAWGKAGYAFGPLGAASL